MAKPSQSDIEHMIQHARPTNRDLVRRDINQAINSTNGSLLIKIASFIYPNQASKELLCLYGTVTCRYRGGQYNIPVEIWLQQDHPKVAPRVCVRPTADMYVSPASRDVQPDGTVIIPYLRNWRHPQSDIANLINAMSEAFSQTPPVYAASSAQSHQTNYPAGSTTYPPGSNYPNSSTIYPTASTPYPTGSTLYPTSSMPYPNNPPSYPNNPTPYPTNPTPYPTNSSMPMPLTGSSSYSYSQGYGQTDIPENVYRNSIQTAVLDKVRLELKEAIQCGNAEIDSLKKTQQDLLTGEKKIQSLIVDAQQQQIQAQNYIANLRTKITEASETAQNSTSTSDKENSIKDDAIVLSLPVHRQLFQAYAEEHAIQDLLYHLADGLRRESIGLDTYLKHVRELSRKQFMLRATMQKCRHIAGLPVK